MAFEAEIDEKDLSRALNDLLPRGYSPDGKCGPENGGLTCDPRSTVYSGTCCSQYGWCGNTIDFCGAGCTSGCTIGTRQTATSAVAASTTEEPVLGSPSAAPASGPDTTDGTCGAGNGDTVCGNWPQGACCSLYGVGTPTRHALVRTLTVYSSVEIPLLIVAVGASLDHV